MDYGETIKELIKKRDELRWYQINQCIKINKAITQLTWLNSKFDKIEIN